MSKNYYIGYMTPDMLIEVTRDALRRMNKRDKQLTCRRLIREIVRWSSFSIEEAVGFLDCAKTTFLMEAEDNFISVEKVKERYRLPEGIQRTR